MPVTRSTYPLFCSLLLVSLTTLPAQATTLSSDQVLRIHFSIPSPPSPQPDVPQFGLGLVTVNAAYTTRTARLWDCDNLLGTAVSPSFGSHVGALALGVCNSWRQTGSVWNFDNPGDVPSFAPLQNATIQGIIDFQLGTGSITLDLANLTMQLVQATSAGGGFVGNPGPVVHEVVVVPKLAGPSPGTAGSANTWTTTGGVPGGLLVYAFSVGCAPGLFPSNPPVYFDLAPPLVLFAAIADASGASTLSLAIPATASGFTLLTQVGELNLPALRVTNFVRHTFP